MEEGDVLCNCGLKSLDMSMDHKPLTWCCLGARSGSVLK